MPATVTLSSTTLAQDIDHAVGLIKVASTSGMLPKMRLFCDGEVMTVVSLSDTDPWVNVLRGSDGSPARSHSAGSTIYIARGDQLYSTDPVGEPYVAIPVSPHINVLNGKVWFAQGDPVAPGTRWWQAQTTTYDVGALGVRTQVVSPTSST